MIIDPSKIPADLGTSILKTLCHLAEHGDTPPSRLAEVLGISTGAMTGLADAVEKRGLAQRDPHPWDRRVTRLALTREGRELVEGLKPEPATLSA